MSKAGCSGGKNEQRKLLRKNVQRTRSTEKNKKDLDTFFPQDQCLVEVPFVLYKKHNGYHLLSACYVSGTGQVLPMVIPKFYSNTAE